MAIGYAVLGAGIFAKSAYIPALAKLPPGTAELKAVYSRSEASAQSLATAAREALALAVPPDVYYGEGGVDTLFARADVHAVILILPITTQPGLVRAALAAGKHVLSEKPVAADVRAGRELVALYEAEYKPKGLVWRVAEDFEMEPALRKAGEAIRAGRIGRVMFFEACMATLTDKENPYYKTPWRTVPGYQGGFLLDGGVHFVAGLRMLLPSPITHLSSFAALNREHLVPKDTLQTIARTADGVTGTFTLTFGAPDGAYGVRNGWFIAGADGALTITRTHEEREMYSVSIRAAGGKDEVEEVPVQGVEQELKAFFTRIAGATEDGSQNPRGPLADVAFIEAALNSEGQLVDLEAMLGKCAQ
ncbi:oxidoreductase family protein [Vararia minispora EC-137]|uniref:Oxidoreductase family protein n=1 Tax=Vararia minispora EC-137 TaxID=1314806 RepID=A0ACB8QMY6_9AGAM|nr:oxidoreductase family protein [Vararia minispora EC-137]